MEAEQRTRKVAVGDVLLTIVTAIIVFLYLGCINFALFSFFIILEETGIHPNHLILHMIELVVALATAFLGAFMIMAHKRNLLKVSGAWSEHLTRNHIGLGVVIGAASIAAIIIYVVWLIRFF